MIFKRRLRSLFDHSAHRSGLLRGFERRMNRGLTVLTYHRVLSSERCRDYPLRSLVMPESAFREQVRWLASRCDVRPLGEAIAELANGRSRERPLASITFDDGYDDNHAAARILEEHGLRGTFFVTTAFSDTGEMLWFDVAATAFGRLPREKLEHVALELGDGSGPVAVELAGWMDFLKRLPPRTRAAVLAEVRRADGDVAGDASHRAMSREQVIDLHRRGHEVGSHTVTHPILPGLVDAELREELERSRERLADWLAEPPMGFCYPNGDHDERVVRAVAEAGYGYACTTAEDINLPGSDPLLVKRLDVTPDRVLDHRGRHDIVGFRSEVSALRRALR